VTGIERPGSLGLDSEPEPALPGVQLPRPRETGEEPAIVEPRQWLRRRRRWAIGFLVITAALATWDAQRAPSKQWAARGLLAMINGYQATLSPLMPALGVQCRFEPTCSRYSEAVIRRYGAWGGLLRAAWRVARCGPWTASGTYDPPPTLPASDRPAPEQPVPNGPTPDRLGPGR
jgi:putative membrane protein insertion efficiency factor